MYFEPAKRESFSHSSENSYRSSGLSRLSASQGRSSAWSTAQYIEAAFNEL
jgi:hypothetical protein